MYQNLGSTDILLYDLLNTTGILFILIFNLLNIGRKKEFLSNFSKKIIAVSSYKNAVAKVNFFAIAETLLISLFQIIFIPLLNKIFGNLLDTGMNYFGYVLFIPVILFVLFYVLSINPFKQMDLIVPASPLALFFAKLGCFFHGCCNGIECSFGLFNHDTGLVEFPVQLVEAGLALLIFVFLLFWKEKAKEGTLFPTYLIIYSATRFFSEFIRSEPNVLGPLKIYHILCIIGVIVGIAELLIVLKFSDKIKNLFDREVLPELKEKDILHHKYKKK